MSASTKMLGCVSNVNDVEEPGYSLYMRRVPPRESHCQLRGVRLVGVVGVQVIAHPLTAFQSIGTFVVYAGSHCAMLQLFCAGSDSATTVKLQEAVFQKGYPGIKNTP